MSPPPDPLAALFANRATLAGEAIQAITNNINYLGVGTPTQAQAIAQVAALTRQVDGIIRVLLGALDVTDGT